jgi:hypothetical protein
LDLRGGMRDALWCMEMRTNGKTCYRKRYVQRQNYVASTLLNLSLMPTLYINASTNQYIN